MRIIVIFLFFLNTINIFTQNEKISTHHPEIKVSGLLDFYYVYDFNQPQSIERQPFLFNHNRHNEFNLNLGLLKLAINNIKYRANFALHTGTYANDNYASEPGLLKNIFEANIGISLNKKNNLWLDAGIMPSHIGFESAISMDNWTMTRSILAENSPYFLTGAKITYNPNEKLEISGLIINGWQRIQRLEGNSLLSFGTQLKYSPIEKVSLNWSTFIGTDDPDTERRIRYFNNFYGQFQVSKNIGLIGGFDIGIQQKAKESDVYDTWFSPVIIAQFAVNNKIKSALRAEYYQDEKNIIIPKRTANGFRTLGLSSNFDFIPYENILCRFEARWLNNQELYFNNNGSLSKQNFILAASMAIKF
jgi:hypothetical protein